MRWRRHVQVLTQEVSAPYDCSDAAAAAGVLRGLWWWCWHLGLLAAILAPAPHCCDTLGTCDEASMPAYPLHGLVYVLCGRSGAWRDPSTSATVRPFAKSATGWTGALPGDRRCAYAPCTHAGHGGSPGAEAGLVGGVAKPRANRPWSFLCVTLTAEHKRLRPRTRSANQPGKEPLRVRRAFVRRLCV